MSDVYDKVRTAALIKEARQLTADLKVEVKEIETQMGRVLEGDQDEKLDVPESEAVADDADFLKVTPPKFFWRFWR
jgi:hypothetical protein